jgi:hypothetical protein
VDQYVARNPSYWHHYNDGILAPGDFGTHVDSLKTHFQTTDTWDATGKAKLPVTGYVPANYDADGSRTVNGVNMKVGVRYGKHTYVHGRRLSGNSVFKVGIAVRCTSATQCNEVTAKMLDPSFITNVASAASIPPDAIPSVDGPFVVPVTTVNITTVTTVDGTPHTHTTPAIQNTYVEGVDERWKAAAVAMTILSIILFCIVIALAAGGKKRGSSNSGAVKASGVERALDETESYTV